MYSYRKHYRTLLINTKVFNGLLLVLCGVFAVHVPVVLPIETLLVLHILILIYALILTKQNFCQNSCYKMNQRLLTNQNREFSSGML